MLDNLKNKNSGRSAKDSFLESLASSFQSSELSFFIFSKERHLIYNNDKASTLLDQYAVLNKKPFTKEKFFEHSFNQVISTGTSYNERNKSFQFFFTPVFFENNLIAVSLQITESFSSEPKLESEYLSILDQLPVHIWLLNKDGQIFWQNKALREYFNLSSKNTITDEWINLIEPSELEKVNQDFNQFLNTEQPFYREIKLQNNKGDFEYFHSIRKPVLDSKNEIKYWINVNCDVTDSTLKSNNLLKLIDEKDKLMQEKRFKISQFEGNFFKAQKIETLGKLAGGIAHDFNNILLMISLSIGLIQMKDDKEEYKDEVEHILNSIKRGSKLASKLMTFAGKSPNLPTIINLNQELPSIKPLIIKSVGKEIKLDFFISDNLWNLYVDLAYLENTIHNLVLNSKDALIGRSNPNIVLKIENYENYDQNCEENIPIGSYVYIKISDNGAGISQENINKIFDPFFTTKEVNTGLGLSVIYGFINKSQGKIIIESTENTGTDVHIYLPKAENQNSNLDNNSNKTLEDKPQLKVLIIEDDALLRNGLVRILESNAYQCFSANDAHSAYLYIKNGLEIDIIVSDVMMPGPMNALEFYNSITEMGVLTPILYTSGYAENIIVKDGEVINNFNFLMKPYGIAELLEKMESIISETSEK